MRATDWPGLGLLAVFMVTLILGLQALAPAHSAPVTAVVALAAAAIAFAILIGVEKRRPRLALIVAASVVVASSFIVHDLVLSFFHRLCSNLIFPLS